MAVQVDSDNADGARTDERFNMIQIHDKGVIDVREHRARTEVNQWFYAGKCRVTRYDDFVARTDSLELVQEIDDHRPGTAENTLGRTSVRGKLPFKLVRFFTEDILAGTDGAQSGFLDFGTHEAF
jgi:hypothetical protein